MQTFIKIFFVKLFFSTIFIFLWIGFFPSLAAFFNPDSGSYDSIRYNRDAYVMATGGSDFWEIDKNAFTIVYGFAIYKYLFIHPWFITLSNCIISCSSTFILYKCLLPFMQSKRVQLIFWMSNFFPVLIAYEAILGKETFYLAGFKLIVAILILLFFSPSLKRWPYIVAIIVMLFVFSYARPVLLPYLVLGIVCYYLKPSYTIFAAIIAGTVAFATIKQIDMAYLENQNVENLSSYPAFQVLRDALFSKSIFLNLIYGAGRFIVYLIYPFPLIIPDIHKIMHISSVNKCARLLTICEQLSFWWQIVVLGIVLKTPKQSFLASYKLWLYLFWVNISCLIFLAYSYPLLHARYRIFFFIIYGTIVTIIVKFTKLNLLLSKFNFNLFTKHRL